MFRQTYKSTLKNIVRSKLFIFILLVSFGVIVYTKLSQSGSTIIFNSVGEMKTITKTDPRFAINYGSYIKYITNSVRATVSSYVGPLGAIVSTLIVLERELNDNFFEIEKSHGIISSKYAISKLLALITVNFTFVTVASLFIFHFYILMFGGVKMVGWEYYLIDSSIRLMRALVIFAFPCSLIYISVTYMAGTLIKSVPISAVASIAYLLFNLSSQMKAIIPETYFNYLTPLPLKAVQYFQWYDAYDFDNIIAMHEVTSGQVSLCYAWFAVLILTCIIVSCIAVKKRHV